MQISPITQNTKSKWLLFVHYFPESWNISSGWFRPPFSLSEFPRPDVKVKQEGKENNKKNVPQWRKKAHAIEKVTNTKFNENPIQITLHAHNDRMNSLASDQVQLMPTMHWKNRDHTHKSWTTHGNGIARDTFRAHKKGNGTRASIASCIQSAVCFALVCL